MLFYLFEIVRRILLSGQLWIGRVKGRVVMQEGDAKTTQKFISAVSREATCKSSCVSTKVNVFFQFLLFL